jgi:hypothetical protein
MKLLFSALVAIGFYVLLGWLFGFVDSSNSLLSSLFSAIQVVCSFIVFMFLNSRLNK